MLKIQIIIFFIVFILSINVYSFINIAHAEQLTTKMYAWLDGEQVITVSLDSPLQLKFENESEGFSLYESEGASTRVIAIDRIVAINLYPDDSSQQLNIITKEKLNVRANYTLQHDGYCSSSVGIRNALNDKQYFYNGDDLGCNYSSNKTTFKLWAPTALAVMLYLRNSPDSPDYQTIDMLYSNNGVWVANVSSDIKNYCYSYSVTVYNNGQKVTNLVADPYSEASTANSHYSLVIDWSSVNRQVSGWANDKPVITINPTDAIIYEAHVRDLSIDRSAGVDINNRGKYLGVVAESTRTAGNNSTLLDHYKELGITHLQLLPIFDYATGNELDNNANYSWYNWGYDPILYNCPEGSYASNANNYSRQIELKQLITKLHANNIGLVMDMVYNHTYQTQNGPFSIFDKITPGYYYRLKDNGEYWNGSGCGNDIASERPMVRKFLVDSIKFWFSQYHLDGIRLDLMGLLDRETVNQMLSTAKTINPYALFYGESWNITSGIATRRQMIQDYIANSGVGAFNDGLRDDLRGDVFNDNVGGFIEGFPPRHGLDRLFMELCGRESGGGSVPIKLSNPSESVAYISCHDNLNLWDKICQVNPTANRNTKLKMVKFGFSNLLTAEGVMFIQAGDEFARSKRGCANSYNNNSPDVNPINWRLKDENKSLFDYVKSLVALRKTHPAFRIPDGSTSWAAISRINAGTSNIIAYTIDGSMCYDSWQKIVVIHNASDAVQKIPTIGSWNIAANGDKISTIEPLYTEIDNITVNPLSTVIAWQ